MIQRAPLAETSDETLAEKSAAGDSSSFEELMQRYYTETLHFLVRFVGRRHHAEDAYQDSMLRVYRKIGRFDSSRTFRPWYFTVVTNVAKDFLRKEGRHFGNVSLDERDSRDELIHECLDERAKNPATEASYREGKREITACILADSNDPMIQPVRMTSLGGMRWDAAAADLNIPLGTFKSRYDKGIRMIREVFSAEDYAPEAA